MLYWSEIRGAAVEAARKESNKLKARHAVVCLDGLYGVVYADEGERVPSEYTVVAYIQPEGARLQFEGADEVEGEIQPAAGVDPIKA
jgi:hypothetical protein